MYIIVQENGYILYPWMGTQSPWQAKVQNSLEADTKETRAKKAE